MTPEEKSELDWITGNRAAWKSLLGTCIRELVSDEQLPLSAEKLLLERAEAIATLRQVCETFGDNDWTDNLYLPDIIDKHLARHLHENTDDSGQDTLFD